MTRAARIISRAPALFRYHFNHPTDEEIRVTQRAPTTNRRRFIKLAAAVAGAPLASVLVNGAAHAQTLPLLSETDTQAVALGYKHDATKAPARKDAQAHCANCSLYTGKPGAAEGPCGIFPGKAVAAKGWCTAWSKKA
jgi:hypothetical protein